MFCSSYDVGTISSNIKIHLAAELLEKTDGSLNMPSPELRQQEIQPRGDLYLKTIKFGYMLCTNEP